MKNGRRNESKAIFLLNLEPCVGMRRDACGFIIIIIK